MKLLVYMRICQHIASITTITKASQASTNALVYFPFHFMYNDGNQEYNEKDIPK